MGSLEDLFSRVESSGNTQYNQIVNWLSDDGKRNKSSYSNIAAILAEPFGLEESIKSASITTIDDYEKDVNSLTISNAKSRLRVMIKDRRAELKGRFEKIEKANETKYKKQINAAKTSDEIEEVLSNAKRDTQPETFEEIERIGQNKLNDLNRKEEKIKQREAEKKERERILTEQKAEAIRKTREGQARAEARREAEREREREIEREYERELRFQEEQLNLQEQT